MDKTITMSLEDARKLYATSTPEWKKILEDNFGKENLIVLTYRQISEKLFTKKLTWYCNRNEIRSFEIDTTPAYPGNCITEKQAEHLMAHNQLINVAAYLNTEDKRKEQHSFVYITFKKNIDDFRIFLLEQNNNYDWGVVLFNNSKLAKQAIEILGKETIIKALTYE